MDGAYHALVVQGHAGVGVPGRGTPALDVHPAQGRRGEIHLEDIVEEGARVRLLPGEDVHRPPQEGARAPGAGLAPLAALHRQVHLLPGQPPVLRVVRALDDLVVHFEGPGFGLGSGVFEEIESQSIERVLETRAVFVGSPVRPPKVEAGVAEGQAGVPPRAAGALPSTLASAQFIPPCLSPPLRLGVGVVKRQLWLVCFEISKPWPRPWFEIGDF